MSKSHGRKHRSTKGKKSTNDSKKRDGNKPAHLKQIWVDGSLMTDEGLAGGAAVICNGQGALEEILYFSLGHIDVTASFDVEMLSFAIVLSQMKHNGVGHIEFDNSFIERALRLTRADKEVHLSNLDWINHIIVDQIHRQSRMSWKKIGRRDHPNQIMADSFARAATGTQVPKYGIHKTRERYGWPKHARPIDARAVLDELVKG